MTLLSGLKSPGHLDECIVHYNHGLDEKERGLPKVNVARAFFDGLNKLQTEWTISHTDSQRGEVNRFQRMILDGLQDAARVSFLASESLWSLVSLNPQIMNHDTLSHAGYRPGIAIDSDLRKKASQEHHRLAVAYHDLERSRSSEIKERVIKRSAELLYIVRCNIAHGEKTPFGPDLAKRDRDGQVCSAIVPLQEQLFEYLLDAPSNKLVSYGSLSPGEANHQIIVDVKGIWEECIVHGHINLVQGLRLFSWDLAAPEVNAQLLNSTELPTVWHRIDAFEGSRYKRRLIPVRRQAGLSVANVYVGI